MVLALLATVIGLRQVQPISLEIRGVRLENAAPVLAQKLGYDSIEIDPTLRNDVLLIRTKDADAEVLKTNIARVLNATWMHDSKGWSLWQSAEQKAVEKRTYNTDLYDFGTKLTAKANRILAGYKPMSEAEVKRINSEIQAIAAMPTNANNNKAYVRANKLDEIDPLKRLAYQIVHRMTPDMWTKVTEQNPRLVYSSNPTAMQQPFPFRIDDLVAMAVEEQNQWSMLAGPMVIRPRSNPDEIGMDGNYLGSLNSRRKSLKTSDFSLVTMTLDLNDKGIEIRTYNENGISDLECSVDGTEQVEYDGLSALAEFENLKRRMVKLTGDAAEYMDICSPLDEYVRHPLVRNAISSSLLEKLLHPDSIDPLSISAPDVFLNGIDTPNIVMILSDAQRSSRFPEFKDAKNKELDGQVLGDSNGWLLVNQLNPMKLRKLTPDRKRLGNAIRLISTIKRPLNLEEQAALAIQLPWNNDCLTHFEEYLRPLQPTDVNHGNGIGALRIYGSLDSTQREAARKGGISLGSLSEAAKLEIFRSIFFESRYESSVTTNDIDDSKLTETQQKQLMLIQEQTFSGILEEKTILLPRGLSNNMRLVIEDRSSSSLYCGQQGTEDELNYYSGVPMDPSRLGEYLFRQTNPSRFKGSLYWGKIDEDEIHLTSERNIGIKLIVSDNHAIEWRLDQTLVTDPATYSVKTLPKEITEAIKKGYEEAEKEDKGYRGPGNRRTIPPPPVR